jgi:hypothetical protein
MPRGLKVSRLPIANMILFVQSSRHLENSNLQRTFLAQLECFSNAPRPTSWSARLIVLVLTTTFKCSLKAFLTSTTLSSPPSMMALRRTRCWAGVMFLVRPHLEDSTQDTYSLQILEHVDWKIPNNFDTSCVIRPCCNRARAFNLLSFSNVLMGKENFAIVRENILRDHTSNQKWEEEP